MAFTDRHGGTSTAPYDSLDLGDRRGVDPDMLTVNLGLVAHALDVSRLTLMGQVHGRKVQVVRMSDSSGVEVVPGCDALVTTARDVALGVRVADCVPVVLADIDRGVVGVAHAGRRGVVYGVVQATIDAMAGLGAAQIEAWVGPHVCGGCYEVPAELRSEVASTSPAAFACTTRGTASLDLGAAVAAQLCRSGCVVHDVSRCTRESADLYSYRRDGASAGRSAGLVVLRSGNDG